MAELRYTPWGATRYTAGSTPTSYQYTGQRKDATGLYFYNARYYDPALGRFLAADAIVPSPGNPQSLNRYSYVLNNPLRYTDPTGHRECGEYCDPSDMGTTEGENSSSPASPLKLPLSGVGLYLQGGAGADFFLGAKYIHQYAIILNWESWELSYVPSYGVLVDVGTPELVNVDGSGGLLLLNGWSSNDNLRGWSRNVGVNAQADVGFQFGAEVGASWPMVENRAVPGALKPAIDYKYGRTPVIVNVGAGAGWDMLPNGGDVSVTFGPTYSDKVLTVDVKDLVRFYPTTVNPPMPPVPSDMPFWLYPWHAGLGAWDIVEAWENGR